MPIRRMSRAVLVVCALSFALAGACSGDTSTNSGPVPVGAPCIPTEEFDPTFGGFQADSIDIESGSKACDPGMCLIVNFQGRVSCPYGQAASATADPSTGQAVVDPNIPTKDLCYTEGAPLDAAHRVRVPVPPQLVNRSPDSAVYCSCRCAGPDPMATYCACPSGYVCQSLIDSGDESLQGSYCMKAGTVVTDIGALENGPSCSLSNVQARPNGCGLDEHPSD